jgi:hypothetical protein
MHCIAYAFEKLGCTNVQSHGNFHTHTLPLLLVMLLSHNQRCRDETYGIMCVAAM